MSSLSLGKAALIGLLTTAALAGGAVADGMAKRSMKDAAPKEEARRCTWSVNIGAASEYVFRGISQSAEDAVLQGGGDLTCGMFYAGVWASGIDFGEDAFGRGIANVEVDWYAGFKPVWGPLTFDLGVIYYAYPNANDGGPTFARPRELDYVELKLGVSGSPVDKLTLGGTIFYSPEYTAEQGAVWTLEATAAYEFAKIWMVTPTLSALVGWQSGDFSAADFAAGRATFVTANGSDDYVYWNIGLALAIDKLTLDFRYWDTNIDNNGAVGTGFCTGQLFQCDSRFVFSAKVTLP